MVRGKSFTPVPGCAQGSLYLGDEEKCLITFQFENGYTDAICFSQQRGLVYPYHVPLATQEITPQIQIELESAQPFCASSSLRYVFLTSRFLTPAA